MTISRSRAGSTETLAALAGVFGAAWLALGLSRPVVGWLAFLLSNALWIAFARACGHRGLGWQHAAFTVTSVAGIVNTWGL